MSLMPPSQLLRDQFTVTERTPAVVRRPRWLQIWLAVPAVTLGVLVGVLQVRHTTTGPLFLVTGILLGLTTNLALRFWERSVDARKDPVLAMDGQRLALLDRMRTHLVWTVVVGATSTIWLLVMAVLAETPPPSWLSFAPNVGVVGASSLVMYQITLVAGALLEFYEASYSLRQ